MNNNIYGLGVGFWMVSDIIWTGAGRAYPLGIYGQCHWMHLIIGNKTIYGLGVGIWTFSRIFGLLWNEGVLGSPLGNPRSVSLDGSYHKEQQYIWFRGGDLNNFWDIRPYMKWREWGIPLGNPSQCLWFSLIIMNNNIYGLWVGTWIASETFHLL